MKEVSKMFEKMTYADAHNATSSSATSGSCHTRFDALDGQMIELFGLVPVSTKLSAPQAKGLDLMMSDTSGLHGCTASPNISSAARKRSATLLEPDLQRPDNEKHDEGIAGTISKVIGMAPPRKQSTLGATETEVN